MKPINGTGDILRWSDLPDDDCIAALMYLYQVHSYVEQSKGADTRIAGFKSTDADFMCSIAERIQMNTPITERQLSLMKYKLNGYYKQLRGVDIGPYKTHWSLVRYETNAPTSSWRKCTLLNADTMKLEFGYDPSLINRVKTLSGRKFVKTATQRYWTAPTSKLNIKQVLNMGFELPIELQTALKSTAKSYDYSGMLMQLRPYQIAGADRLAGELKLNGMLADEMGLGKSAQALAALWAKRKTAFPALIVCPGSLKYVWASEITKWLPDISVRVLNGRCNRQKYTYRNEYEITVINYDILADWGNNAGWAQILKETGFQTAIFDECHKMKNPKAKRTMAILDMGKGIANKIALSGTPIESRPIEFFTTLQLVAPKLFPNYWTYGTRYCGGVQNGFGVKFNGASNTQELNDILTENCMIRRRKADVLTELPPKQRQVIPVQIDMRQYGDMEKSLVSFLQKSKGVMTAQDQANVLAQIERCKQAAVLGKLKQAQEFIENYLETGKKLVVFATHTFTLDALEGAFLGHCVRIDGSTAMSKREAIVNKFQTDKNTTLFLGNIKAAGVGLTLTTASDTLTLELGWTPGEHEQAEDRVHRIGQQADSVMAYYMIAKDTIEQKIMELLDEKRKILSQVLDGREVSQSSLLSELIKQYVPETKKVRRRSIPGGTKCRTLSKSSQKIKQ